jgi:hypothetical protein
VVEYFDFDFPPGANLAAEPNERVLIDMLTALLELVAEGPRKPARAHI